MARIESERAARPAPAPSSSRSLFRRAISCDARRAGRGRAQALRDLRQGQL